jgi:hypothetical protein
VGVLSGPELTPEIDPHKDEPLGLYFVWFSSLIREIIEQGDKKWLLAIFYG